MAAVTQTITNFLGGVSNQPDTKKLPGQVTAAVNAYTDPTFGLQKRPGFKFMDQLTDGSTEFNNTDLDNAKWFFYNRDSDEKYIGCIIGNASASNAAIHVWNTEPDSSGNYIKCTVNYASNAKDYLSAVNSYDYDFLTIRDTSIITNKQKTITAVAGAAHTDNKVATVRIHMVEYSAKYEIKLKITSSGNESTATYDTYAQDTFADNTATNNALNANGILTELKSDIDGFSITGLTATIVGASLEISHTEPFTLQVKGGKGGESLTAYQNTVDSIAELTGETIHNRVVKIQNTGALTDSYYTKFKAEDGTSGPGIWEESIAPGVETGLTPATMPHKLYNSAKNVFSFEPITWVDRKAGDDVTNEHPSFKGKTIQQAFFYNNRLGFLTEDNVSMSQAGEFYNFYFTTAQTVIDSDPVDLSCSSTRPAVLHGIIPTAGGLLLFSQNQQFIMFSADGNLSPSTALIRGLSNYRMDTKIDPVDVGTYINFVSKTHDSAGYTRVFAMLPQGAGQSPRVVDIGRAVSEFIPVTIDSLITSPQNSFIAMYGKADPDVYFYRTYNDGEKDVVQSWFSWKLPGDAHYLHVDSDTMYAVIKTGTGSAARYNLASATLTQTPEETVIVTSDGQSVNPHMDFYAKASSVTYTEADGFSKVNLPYTDITSLKPVIVIAGSSDFTGVTESGFTISPNDNERPSYWKVPNKDLSGQAANVYVGYKYDYDITLPKLYFRPQGDAERADYTANLTVARMKFNVGQSSVVGFKLKSKGYKGPTETFTGDGSNKIFSPSFSVEDKADVKVKLNGALQTLGTNYSIADHATVPNNITITFVTAPAGASTAGNVTTAASTVEIYVDNWSILHSTQEANYYLADDIPLDTESVFTVPIHQRSDNYTLRVFSDSPFPVSINSATWEGQYSPRYYRRT